MNYRNIFIFGFVTVFLPVIITYMVYFSLESLLSPMYSLIIISLAFFSIWFVVEKYEPFEESFRKNLDEMISGIEKFQKAGSSQERRRFAQRILYPWGKTFENFRAELDSPLEVLFQIIDFRHKKASKDFSQELGVNPSVDLFEGLPSLNKRILRKMRRTDKVVEFAEEIKDYWIKTSYKIIDTDKKKKIVRMEFCTDMKERKEALELLKTDKSFNPYHRYSKIRRELIRNAKKYLDGDKTHDEMMFFGISSIYYVIWMLEDCPLIIGKEAKEEYYGRLLKGIDSALKGIENNKSEEIVEGLEELLHVVNKLGKEV